MTYKASKDGKVIKHNGNGIYFNNSGEHTITITNADIGGGGGSSGGTSGGTSGGAAKDVTECVSALNKVFNCYPSGSAQFSGSRDAEIKNCWAAASATDWSKLMKVYYCEHPGVPVRKCFTYGAKGLKDQGYTQKNAYKAMYATCQTNGSFSTMNSSMLSNFKQIMLEGYRSSNDTLCISKFGRSL